MNYESSHSENLILQVASQAACNNKWVTDEEGMSSGLENAPAKTVLLFITCMSPHCALVVFLL